MNEHIPDIETYIKRLNWYLQEHYPANKKTTAEEWNALFLALINQGNAQEDTLAKICNEYLPLQIEKINTLVDTTNEHEASIAQLRTDTNKALKDSNYAVITADTALNQVVEKMGTVAYINNVLAPSLHYTRDPQAQLDDTAQGIINLQSQIDLMEQNTNVADVVGTFVDLVNYDKSKITANDIVEVLQDETRANADTYYRLVENAWVYIGKLGSYYTRGESDALLAKKINYADYKDTLSFAESERQKSKNLFDYTKTYEYSASSSNNNGSYNINIENSYYSEMKYKLKMKIGQPYSFSAYITYFTSTESSVYFSARFVYTDGTGGENNTKVVEGQRVHFVLKPAKEVDYIIFRLLRTDVQATTKGIVSDIQIEEGSVATDYQPYNGQIIHNGDAPVVFAESERQKTLNLLRITQLISSETVSGVTVTTDLENQTITLNGTPTGYSEKGINISNLILKANKKYSVVAKTVSGSVSYTSGSDFYINLNNVSTWSNFFKNLPKYANFTTDKEIWRILLSYNNKVTFNNLVIQLQIQEGEPSDWQYPYGAIVHEKEFHETLQNTPAIVFAESERQKSKNLLCVNQFLEIKSGLTITGDYDTQKYIFNGTSTDAFGSWLMCKSIKLEANKSYTFSTKHSGNITINSYAVLYLYAKNGVEIGSISLLNQEGHFAYTPTEDIETHAYILFDCGSNNVFSNFNLQVQIEEGSVATDYQPYNGQITHNGDPAVTFAEGEYQKSKNLFNENKYLISYCTYASNRWTTNSTRIGYNQSILTNETGATDNRNTSKLPLLKKGTYTLTIFNTVNNTNDTHINIALYNQDGTINGTFTNVTITTNTTITFTLASDLYLDIRVNGNVGTISFDHIQIEEGSTATTYQTYYGQITHNEDAPVVFADAERQKSKNLFNAPNIPLPTGVTYNSSTNTFTYTSGEVAEGATKFAQLNNVVMPAGNYVYSFDSTSTITGDTTYIVAKLTSTGGFGSSIATKVLPAGKVSIPFTLTEDTYIGLCWYYKTGWSAGSAPAGSKTISNVQLEEGSTATEYQPYYGKIVHQIDIAPIVLYDKNSANANINWGYTSGITTSTGLTLEDKDFNGYSRLRCYFTTEGARDGIYNGAFIVDVDLTEQVNKAGDNNYYCGIASTITPYSLTVDNYFEIAICRVGVDSTKSKITFGEYGWNKTAVVGRGTPCYKIEGIK